MTIHIENTLPEPVLRQRRNLILSAMAVFLFVDLKKKGAEVTIIDFIGFKVKVPNEFPIGVYLGVILTYFIIRYLQYFYHFNFASMRLLFWGAVHKMIYAAIKKELKGGKGKKILKPGPSPKTGKPDLHKIFSGEFTHFPRGYLNLHKAVIISEDEKSFTEHDIVLAPRQKRRFKADALINILIKHPYGTDFVLPILFALWSLMSILFDSPSPIAVIEWMMSLGDKLGDTLLFYFGKIYESVFNNLK